MRKVEVEAHFKEFYDQAIANAMQTGRSAPHYVIGAIQACLENTANSPAKKLAHVEYILGAFDRAQKGA